MLVKIFRATVPHRAVGGIEAMYRVGRVKLLSMLYGRPARSLKVIAVTGTNGKTTTVNFINEILKAAGLTTAMFSTAQIEVAGVKRTNDLNATVGTVRYMQRFFKNAKEANIDYVVMEFPSHALVQHKLDDVPVEVAIMTNLTQDHLDYHKTMQHYAEAKALLFKRKPRFIILNHDDEWFEYYDQFIATEKKVSYGKTQSADIGIANYRPNSSGSRATLSFQNTSFHVKTYLPGEFNIYNIAAAAAASVLLGVTKKAIEDGVASLQAIPGRFEFVDQPLASTVIVDYAHTPDGLEKILTAVREITSGKLTLVFGACGDRDKAKRPIMGEIAARLADSAIVTDEETYTESGDAIRRQILEGTKEATASTRVVEIADREAAIIAALEGSKKGDTVLVTGLGHEVFRIMDGKKVPWNDSQVIQRVAATLKSKK